jgi:hypothetical protein
MIISYESLIAGETGKVRRHTGVPDGEVEAVVVVATATATPIIDNAEPAAYILVLVRQGEPWREVESALWGGKGTGAINVINPPPNMWPWHTYAISPLNNIAWVGNDF